MTQTICDNMVAIMFYSSSGSGEEQIHAKLHITDYRNRTQVGRYDVYSKLDQKKKMF